MRLSVVLLLVAAVTAVAGCTSGGQADTSGSSGASGACSMTSAKPASRTFVTASGFSPSCVALKAGSLFSIVNGSSKHQVAATRTGAPASFVADLPRHGSTFSHVYTKRGTYVFVDSTAHKSMTIYVT